MSARPPAPRLRSARLSRSLRVARALIHRLSLVRRSPLSRKSSACEVSQLTMLRGSVDLIGREIAEGLRQADQRASPLGGVLRTAPDALALLPVEVFVSDGGEGRRNRTRPGRGVDQRERGGAPGLVTDGGITRRAFPFASGGRF